MQKRLLLLIPFLYCMNSTAQTNAAYKWTWIGGDNSFNNFGIYGDKGVESPTNKPGARAFFYSWMDKDGNFWIFGGHGSAKNSIGNLNDLWRYNVSNNQWTWMAGDSVPNRGAKHSGQNSEASDNTPGARESGTFWASGDGRELYLFGGFSTYAGYEYYGDVWAFNIGSQKWRLIKFSVYDAVGCRGQTFGPPDQFAPGTYPGCRLGATAVTDGTKAYMFGGSSPNAFSHQFFMFSDYNHYLPQNNQWASIDFPLTLNQPGRYTGNNPFPGSRDVANSFVHNGKFYLFGGWGYGAFVNNTSPLGHLNDVWRYDGRDLLTNKPLWTWLKGDSTVNGSGNYGTIGSTDPSNKPRARGHAMLRQGTADQYLLFGGIVAGGDMNDLWSYNAATNNWTWLSGSPTANDFGNHGTKGIQSNSNRISARSGTAMWVTQTGDVYIFGGSTIWGKRNDMWKFSPQQVPTPSNDEPCTAIPLVLDAAPVTGNNSFATTSAIDGPSTCFGYNNTVWYKYTPSTSGLVQFTLGGGPAGDTLNSSVSIFVPSGSCPGLSLSDSTNSLFGNCKTYSAFGQKSPSVWISHLTAGKTYYIRISGLFNDVGQYALSLQSTGGIVPPQPTITVAANREQTDPLGWTHYYHNNGTPATTDDDIKLVSILKNGNTIGSVGDGTFSLTVGLTAKAGTGRGEVINSPLISSASKFVSMNRYWNVTPTNQPTTPVTIRFYYHSQDLADINGDLAQQVPHFFLRPFKLTGGNPDPVTDWAGATKVTFYRNANSTAGNGWIYTALNTNTHMAEYTISSFSGGGIGGTNDLALPIQIASFTVTLADVHKVNLNWITATESNTKEFVVQRSFDAVLFENIGTVIAAGNSSEKRSYSYLDGLTLGSQRNILYYRLKTVDGDGKFSLSNILPIRLNETKPLLVSLSPNPTQSYVRLLFANAAYFTIHDANGKLLLRRSVVDRTTETVDVSGYVKGSYMLTVYGKNGKKETRWVQKQ